MRDRRAPSLVFRAASVLVFVALAFTACAEPTDVASGQTSTVADSAVRSPTSPAASASSPGPTVAGPIGREQAIEIASKMLRPSVAERADITAELRGWYWEVTFDNISAQADELTPFPLKPPPPPVDGTTVDPYAGAWQTVIIKLDPDSGQFRGVSARQAPKPGPYVDESTAIQSAREFMTRTGTGEDFSWIEESNVEAHLSGDTWVVLFWEEGNANHRWQVVVDAVTGDGIAVSRG